MGQLSNMSERDAVWALQQYEAIRSVLPAAHMPKKSVHAENLGEIADLFDTFLLDAFGVLNVGCLLYTSPSPRDRIASRMPSSA